MYERFYSLRERPFSLTPDPDYLYLSRVHREGLNHLRYGIESHAGFVVITGEIGCGKTTLLQTVLRGLDQQTAISRLVHTKLDARELIEAVMLDFGLEPAPGGSKPYLLRDLARFLVDQRNAGRLVLLVIDEAQNLSESALEEVRMLSNLETEKSKLIQIVLVGQPNLRELLARPSLEQLRQRVTVNYHLQPMSLEETHAYVNHRLRRASIGAPLTFPAGVTDVIYRHSLGVPRKVNIIADAVLLFGYGANKRAIDLELTCEVLQELGCADVECPPAIDARPEIQRASPAPALDLDLQQAAAVDVAAPVRAAVAIDAADHRQGGLVPGTPHRPSDPTAAALYRPRAAPIVAAGSPARFPPSNYRVLNEHRARSDGFWGRLRRNIFGVPKPVFEE